MKLNLLKSCLILLILEIILFFILKIIIIKSGIYSEGVCGGMRGGGARSI